VTSPASVLCMTVNVWVGFLEEDPNAEQALRHVQPVLVHVLDHEEVDVMRTLMTTVCGKSGLQYVRQYRKPREADLCPECLAAAAP